MVLLACLTASAAAHADAALSLSPSSQTVASGSMFSVDVNISGAADLYGYQFDVLFNPNVIRAISSSEGSFLSTGGSTFFIAGGNDNVGGSIAATADSLVSAVPGVNGSGNIAVLSFEAIGSGVSSLALSGVQLLDSMFNVTSGQSSSGSVIVRSGGGSMSAPEIEPNSAVSAITLLFGSLLVLRSYRHKARPHELASRR